jgi:hypothetical protein
LLELATPSIDCQIYERWLFCMLNRVFRRRSDDGISYKKRMGEIRWSTGNRSSQIGNSWAQAELQIIIDTWQSRFRFSQCFSDQTVYCNQTNLYI